MGKLTKGQLNYLRKVEAGGVMAIRGYRKRTGGYDRFVGGETKAREMARLGLIRMPGVADLGRPSKATLTDLGRAALAQESKQP